MSREQDNKKERTVAIVLAAGSGKRMGTSTKKQYLMIEDKPVIYYSLKVFEESFIDDIVLVVSQGDIDFCKKEIVNKYGFHKVKHIVEGGKERYHSVALGLAQAQSCKYVFIHDGARPLIKEDILERAYECVKECDACVVGMPVKDTIKIADAGNNIKETPDRRSVWQVQTPQVFEYTLIKEAYDKLLQQEQKLSNRGIAVTDDAMVVETLTGHLVKLVNGSYENIKITTKEDLKLAACFMQEEN